MGVGVFVGVGVGALVGVGVGVEIAETKHWGVVWINEPLSLWYIAVPDELFPHT